MLQRLVNALRGNVRLEVEGAFPERFLNLCAQRGILFWNVEWLEDTRLRLTVTRRGSRQATTSKKEKSAAPVKNRTPPHRICKAGSIGTPPSRPVGWPGPAKFDRIRHTDSKSIEDPGGFFKRPAALRRQKYAPFRRLCPGPGAVWHFACNGAPGLV